MLFIKVKTNEHSTRLYTAYQLVHIDIVQLLIDKDVILI